MADFYLVRTHLGALKPADGAAEEYINSLSVGEIVKADLRKPRNPGFHNKVMGVLRVVYNNQEKYLSLDAFRFALMIAAGYVDQIALDGDKVAFRPQSIAWDKMDQAKFEEVYGTLLRAIPRLLPQFEGVDLEKELKYATV
jgi:hypothetical protein